MPVTWKDYSPAVCAGMLKALPAPIAIERKAGVERVLTAPDLPQDYIRPQLASVSRSAIRRPVLMRRWCFCPAISTDRIQYDERTNLSKGRWWKREAAYREWFETEIPNCSANQLMKVVLADRALISASLTFLTWQTSCPHTSRNCVTIAPVRAPTVSSDGAATVALRSATLSIARTKIRMHA